jgi:predicted amidohydrolase
VHAPIAACPCVTLDHKGSLPSRTTLPEAGSIARAHPREEHTNTLMRTKSAGTLTEAFRRFCVIAFAEDRSDRHRRVRLPQNAHWTRRCVHGRAWHIVPTIDTPYGRLAAMICVDADFPTTARQIGQVRADILILPVDN